MKAIDPESGLMVIMSAYLVLRGQLPVRTTEELRQELQDVRDLRKWENEGGACPPM
jgi:hypothetical protein